MHVPSNGGIYDWEIFSYFYRDVWRSSSEQGRRVTLLLGRERQYTIRTCRQTLEYEPDAQLKHISGYWCLNWGTRRPQPQIPVPRRRKPCEQVTWKPIHLLYENGIPPDGRDVARVETRAEATQCPASPSHNSWQFLISYLQLETQNLFCILIGSHKQIINGKRFVLFTVAVIHTANFCRLLMGLGFILHASITSRTADWLENF